MSKFLDSLVKQDQSVVNALTYLYQQVRKTNEFLGLENSDALKETYFKLRTEEVGELFKAIDKEDKVEFLDAVVDGLVVVGYEFYLRTDIKPEETVKLGNGYKIDYSISSVENSYTDVTNCGRVITMLEYIFNNLYVNHMQAAYEVVASNNSKFPLVGDLYLTLKMEYQLSDNVFDVQCNMIETKGRYTGVYWEIREDSDGNDRVIFWAKGENTKDGSGNDIHIDYKSPKYVKPATFREPDFNSCWLN